MIQIQTLLSRDDECEGSTALFRPFPTNKALRICFGHKKPKFLINLFDKITENILAVLTTLRALEIGFLYYLAQAENVPLKPKLLIN